ncbi:MULTISPECIES: hypothetical protein [Proteus]|uniref:hypothetical protein n=1 Tax=Proteus TaxID=583 RepID=UPI000E039BCB|nr:MULTISPECIES: hypothetical protein [Proteus]NBL76929.1 hypothetical protein [Proteus sp. G2672]NBM57879.1 hypothetical protein [Proteus sp. G2667]NBM93068.1 hypothetical protein [Proteus sp. G2662]NBN25283.1 hypothetical protein [Proteus sp. G2657]SUB98944.1 Uncharacterised protein [Proteus penneri]
MSENPLGCWKNMIPSTPSRLSPPLAENRSALLANSYKFKLMARKIYLGVDHQHYLL